jgi:hypothetical protein
MKIKMIAAVLAFAANAASAGAIPNGDFATGDLSGWTANGEVTVGNNGSYNYASLYAGLGQDAYTTFSQTLHLDAGDVLTGNAQFFANDYIPYNDDAFVSINGFNLFASSVGAVGDFGTSALTSFNWIATTAGDYVLTAGVANRGDNSAPSELQVSNFAVATNVPEPASIALMGLGLIGVAAMRRKAANDNKP